MSCYLVTGVAGFIANRTARMLLDAGHQVVGVDNMNDYYDVRLKEHRLAQLVDCANFRFYRVDIENMAALEILFSDHRFDAVVNLAARAGVRYSMENPHVYMSTNAMGTLNLLELMRRYDCRKLVLASTSSLYAGEQMPFAESLPVNSPISPYAASKKGAEVMAYSYHYLFGIDVSVVRYFTVYGPAGRPDMSIFRFIRWIDDGTPIELFGDGSQTRDFTYVDDIAAGTVLALKDLGYQIINLGGGRDPRPLTYVIERLEQLLGKRAQVDYRPFHKADLTETRADIGKAGELLGWSPQIDLDQGLQACVDWYLEHRHWLKDIRL